MIFKPLTTFFFLLSNFLDCSLSFYFDDLHSFVKLLIHLFKKASLDCHVLPLFFHMPLSDFVLTWPAQSALLAPLFPSTTETGAFLKDVVTFPFENFFTQNFHPIPQFQSLASVAEWQSGISSPDFLWVRTWASFFQQVFSRKAQIHLKPAPSETANVFSPNLLPLKIFLSQYKMWWHPFSKALMPRLMLKRVLWCSGLNKSPSVTNYLCTSAPSFLLLLLLL